MYYCFVSNSYLSSQDSTTYRNCYHVQPANYRTLSISEHLFTTIVKLNYRSYSSIFIQLKPTWPFFSKHFFVYRTTNIVCTYSTNQFLTNKVLRKKKPKQSAWLQPPCHVQIYIFLFLIIHIYTMETTKQRHMSQNHPQHSSAISTQRKGIW